MHWRQSHRAANQKRAWAPCRNSISQETTWMKTVPLYWWATRTWGSCIWLITNCCPSLPGTYSTFVRTYKLRFGIRWVFKSKCSLCSKLSKLEVLEELNLSGNKLKAIPSTVSSCKRLHTLIAHSNHISVFPEVLNLPEIKVSASPDDDVWAWIFYVF